MCAMQQIYLHGHNDQTTALTTLGELLSGPLCEEVADSLKLVGDVTSDYNAGLMPVALPIVKQLRREFPRLVRAAVRGEVAPVSPSAKLPSGRVAGSVPWTVPRWQEFAIGTLLCVSIATGLQLGKVHEEAVHHVEGYRLRFKPSTAEEGILEVQATEPSMPDRVSLCLSASCNQTAGEILLVGNIGTKIIKLGNIDTFYHVRMNLKRGNIAYSLEEKVPKYELLNSAGSSTTRPQNARLHEPNGETKDILMSSQLGSNIDDQAEFSQPILISSKMVFVPGGSFEMGSNDLPNEIPSHTVKVEDLWIEETEVTVAAYTACVKARRCTAPKYGDLKCNFGKVKKDLHPINCIDWYQASNYCKVIGRRLPTEEEWEYAARGQQERKFAWGNREPGSNQLCWQNERLDTCQVGVPKTDRTPEGVYGMGGNVMEWVNNKYRSCYGRHCPNTDEGIVRGGSSININSWEIRATRRTNFSRYVQYYNIGLRCAK